MGEAEAIRVLIVDDHDVVRRGLAFYLDYADGLELVGEASNGEEAVRLCAEAHPHVVLMDLKMPGMDGIAATQAIHENHPEVQIVVLTSFVEEELVKRVLQAGAVSYLLKDATIDELADTIRAAREGRPTLAPDVTQALIRAATRQSLPGGQLTARENEVLALMAKGLNNRQIAERLMVSHSTVKFHVSSILSKFSVGSRTEAVALALQHNLISPQ